MKKLTVFLVLSLVANAALLVNFLKRAPTPAPEMAGSAPSLSREVTTTSGGATPFAALSTSDAAQLRAAGVPEEVAHQLLLGRAFARLQTRLRALPKRAPSDGRYWRNAAGMFRGGQSKEARAEMTQAQREFSETLRSLGEENGPGNFSDPRQDFFPADKRDQLRRIAQDYAEMQTDIHSEAQGLQLPSDVQKLKMLRDEQERDIAAALTPQEYEDYLLRTSQTAQNVRNRYGDAIQSEEDYRRIYALQKAFDDQYNPPGQSGSSSRELVASRREAESRLQEDILVAIGAENFAAFQRSADQDYKTLNALTTRLNLPATTSDAVFAERDTYAAQSQQINQNNALSAQEKQAQLKTLASTAQADLQRYLGTEGAEVYAQRSQWLSLLKGGSAFSTNPKDAAGNLLNVGSSVYQLPRPASGSSATTPTGRD